MRAKCRTHARDDPNVGNEGTTAAELMRDRSDRERGLSLATFKLRQTFKRRVGGTHAPGTIGWHHVTRGGRGHERGRQQDSKGTHRGCRGRSSRDSSGTGQRRSGGSVGKGVLRGGDSISEESRI